MASSALLLAGAEQPPEAVERQHRMAVQDRAAVADQADRVGFDLGDDGIGGAVITPDGGLGGLRDRIRAIGGDVLLKPVTTGTTVVALLPIST